TFSIGRASYVGPAEEGLVLLAAGFSLAALGLLSAGFVSAGFAAGVSDFASDFGASPLSTRLRFLSLSFLKSVSYQPLPERRNCGAVTRRRTPALPHCGQASGSGSLNFCRRSKTSPQAGHSNS